MGAVVRYLKISINSRISLDLSGALARHFPGDSSHVPMNIVGDVNVSNVTKLVSIEWIVSL